MRERANALRLAGPLSDAARVDRRLRKEWAMPGSSHDRVVAVARVALPLAVVATVALLAIAPVTAGREISFVLSKNRVAMAAERLRVSRAFYRGEDDRGQPFALSAKSAVQVRSSDPVVRLDTVAARIGLEGGPATLTAPTGAYDTHKETVALEGPVAFRSRDGYAIDTHDVDLDMKTRTLASRAPVTGRMPLGTFSGDRMRADLGARTMVLEGRARLHVAQGQGGGAR